MTFTEAVKIAMNAAGMKPSDVAKESRYSSQYIRDLLAGERRWNEESINRVCRALGIEITYKHTGTRSEKKNCKGEGADERATS